MSDGYGWSDLLKLIKYRDQGMMTYTYFWVDAQERIISPFFDSEKEAKAWVCPWDGWKSIRDII
jgi:hypothetical protein